LILLHPVKHSIFTRTIFVRPDSELIRESVYTCAKLFVDEETVHKNDTYNRKYVMNSTKKNPKHCKGAR
jgi:hypothetical protein